MRPPRYIATITFDKCRTGEILWMYRVVDLREEIDRQEILVLDWWSIGRMNKGQGPHCSGVSSWLYFKKKDRRLWKKTVGSRILNKLTDEGRLRKGLTQLFAERGGVEIRLVPSARLSRVQEIVHRIGSARQG